MTTLMTTLMTSTSQNYLCNNGFKQKATSCKMEHAPGCMKVRAGNITHNVCK